MTEVEKEHNVDESGKVEDDSDSWTDIEMDDDQNESDGSQSSSEDNDDDDNGDDSDSDESDRISQILIADEIICGRLVFTYQNEVNLIVKDCHFKGSIKFEFHDLATVKFQNCHFYDRKTVIFHDEYSSLDCVNVQCLGPVFYKYPKNISEFSMNFEKCIFYKSKVLSHRIELNDDDDYEQNATNITRTSKFELFLTHLNEMFTTFCKLIERLSGDVQYHILDFIVDLIQKVLIFCFFCFFVYVMT